MFLVIYTQNVELLFSRFYQDIIEKICVEVEHQKTGFTLGCTFLNQIH